MIMILTPNPAVDITYTVAHVTAGEVHRVQDVELRAGGKGLNVAHVLAALGEEPTVGGVLGTGSEMAGLLEGTGLVQSWTRVDTGVRRSVTLVHDGVATVFNEAGEPVGAEAWDRLARQVRERIGPGDVVVVSGSMPPGTVPEQVAAVVAAARAAGARTVLDTSGPLLLAAARAGADVLKPNGEELTEATGVADLRGGAEALLAAGAGAVVVSRGAHGLLLAAHGVEGAQTWSASPVEALDGNPTGAGDAAVAALARALVHAAPGTPVADVLSAALPDAVALSGAAVLRPVAGEVDLDAYHRMRTEITVEN